MTTKQREQLVDKINNSLINTTDAGELLGVSITRLKKINELQTIIRGYYLKSDVEAYMKNTHIQNRRQKYSANK